MSVRVLSSAALGVTLLAACAGAPNDAAPPPAAPLHAAVASPVAESDEPARPLMPIETCDDSGRDFEGWLASFRYHAIAHVVSRDVVARALATVEYLAEWNKSDVYRRTIVLFASKLASKKR